MGRLLDRKKKRQQAKEQRRHLAQQHHERKKRAQPEAPAPAPVPAAAARPSSSASSRPAGTQPPAAKRQKAAPPATPTTLAAAPVKKSRSVDPLTAAALQREEEEIKRLEKKLGLKGRKSLPKAFADEGLEFLLGWKDDVEELQSQSGYRGKIEAPKEEEEEEEDSGEGEESVSEGGEDGEEEQEESEGEEEGEEEDGDEAADEDDQEEQQEEQEEEAPSKPPSSSAQHPQGKYVPPALRRAASQPDAVVSRRVRAALNKLSPSNLQAICAEIESVFGTAPRADVIAALVQGLVGNAEGAFGRAQIAARAALLVALGGSIGADVTGTVLSAAVRRLDELINTDSSTATPSAPALVSSREDTALLSLLTALQGLGAASPRLLFDLATRLANDFSEDRVELLYQLIQQCGFALRDADAAALRALINSVQEKAAKLSGAAAEGRVKYLLETLTNLRHNKRSLSADDALEPLRKWLRNRSRRCEVLEGGWSEWLAGDVAKRWVMGAGAASKKEEGGDEEGAAGEAATESALEALARKERMNTPGRRAVFCVLMGAEDYTDAVEKLSRLGAEPRAERDIGAVLLHCATREAKFNAFYAHVAARLCALRHSYRVTFQFAFWDKIKEADSMRLPELANLAKLLAHLAGLFSLPLSVLRIIDFEPLAPRHLLLLRLAFDHLFTSFNESVILSAVRRLCAAPRTEDLRDGLLVLFEKGFLEAAKNSSEADLAKLRRGSRIARKVLDEAVQAAEAAPEEAAEEAEEGSE